MSLAELFNKQNEGWFNGNKLTTTGIAGIAGMAGSAVPGLLANGNKSKAGEVMGKLGDVAGMIPGPIGAVAGAALKTIGGLTNAAFGSNLNQQMINNIQNSANKVANTTFNASTVAGLLGEARKNSGFAGFSKKQLGTQGWRSNARDNAYKRLTRLGQAAVSARDLNLTNAAQAIDTTMTNNAKRNITAFGGPINLSGPMEYEIANQQMFNYNNRTNAQAGNLLDNMYAGLYAFGGNIDANGANFSTGLKHVNAGGTHEESPYEGVPMGTDSEGTPNLVEENEVIYNDYVFSDRLKVPVIKVKKGQELQQFEKVLRKYKGLTYASAAKKAEVNSGVDERPNDNIARRGFEFELDILAQSQELERAIDHAESPEEKEQLRQLTPEQFAQIQAEQQAQEQAMQEQMMQQQAMQQQQQQMSPEEAAMQEQMAQMSPEEQAMMQQQMAAQQQGISPEEAAMMQAQGYAEGGELGVPTDDQNITGQAAQMEEAPHAETTMFNAGTPAEEMSTSMLNETIDEIYQYAKEHKNRELLKDARKAKRGSREAKEEFVDDAREDIMMAIEEQEQLAQQQAEQEQALQEQQAAQMPQYETTEEPIQADAGQELDAQMQPQAFAQGGQLNEDQINQLDAFMETLKVQNYKEAQAIYSQYDQLKQQGKINEALQLAMQVYQATAKQQNLYALGGSMDLNNPDGGNIVTGDKIYAGEELSKDEEELLKYLVKKGLKKKWLEGEGRKYFQEELKRYQTAKKGKQDISLDASNLLINNYNGDDTQKRKGRQAFTNAVTTELYPVLDRQGKSITYTNDGRVTYFYPITGGNLNTNILKTNSFGDFTVDNTEGLEALNDNKLPQYEDLAEGYTGKVNYFNLKKPDTKDPGIPYPMPNKTPLLADLAMQAGNYLNNALSNPDYSRAEALIQGGKELQDFTPVKAEMLGNYQKYTPYDINYVNTQARNANQAGLAAIRNMYNGNVGQGMAGILANNYNYNQSIGANYRQAMEQNDKRRNEVSEFNRATDQYNSQADLEAQKANQSADLQSGAAGLEVMGKGYAMMDEIDKNRSAALSAGLTEMSKSLNNYYTQDFANRQAAWRLYHQPRGNMTQFTDADGVTWILNADGNGYSRKKSSGGKLKNRRIVKNILID